MAPALDIQTFGSLIVVGTIATAEAASAYLTLNPASSFAWYLNLSVFRPFELARIDASPLHVLFGPATLPLAVGLLVLTLAVRVLRFRFGVAAIANLCFACTAALGLTWFGDGDIAHAASLTPVAAIVRPDLAVVTAMIASSFLAFVVSHASFVLRIRSDRRRPHMCLNDAR